jgi:hypothetical protein
MLKGLRGNVLKLTSFPLLERPVKKYTSFVVGVNDLPSSIKAYASGCQYSTRALSSLGCSLMNIHWRNFHNSHFFSAMMAIGSSSTKISMSSCSLSL